MRIIGGAWGGRQFHPPKLAPTRPTTDIAKEALFNILQHRIDFASISFLDLFAGTGQITLEVASRGCTDLVAIDKFPKSVHFVRATLQTMGADGATVLKGDVFRYLTHCDRTFDLVFAGPPYPLPNIPDIPRLVVDDGVLAPGGMLVLEHDPSHDFSTHPCFDRVKNYGQTHFSFFHQPEIS